MDPIHNDAMKDTTPVGVILTNNVEVFQCL